MADAEARGCILLDAAEAFGDALSDWLECLVAGAVEGSPPLSPGSVRFAHKGERPVCPTLPLRTMLC